jgi:phosphatidylserine/phosphatidylglycerophosphate/cardiolipin synthase-like enzyme
MIMNNIEGAKESIHTEMFVLSDKNVINGLIDAHNRGVDVKVLLDPNGAGKGGWNPNGRTFDTLKEAGVPVKWYDVDTSVQEKLHAKWGVFDGKEVLNGSANWSYKGLHTNREIASDIVDEKVASVFEKVFEQDWNTKGLDKLPDVPDRDGSVPAAPKLNTVPQNE